MPLRDRNIERLREIDRHERGYVRRRKLLPGDEAYLFEPFVQVGKKIGYAAIRELLGGNTRQGNGRAPAYCRVLPDIAA